MSNIGLIIEERSRDIGDFLVGRLLPFRKKRMVGPFIFIDHMGTSQLGPNSYMDVDQHPHTGLSTLTFMLEGEIVHKDSIGSEQRITPGSVNWMVAGKGVTHTERTPKNLRNGTSFSAHGYQIWVALPKDMEDCNPEFHHIEETALPKWKEGSAQY
jgi:redox-sensitive bicupin YhaK (pirin superfamily)